MNTMPTITSCVVWQDMLFNLAEAADLAGKRSAMFSGEKINNTEGRAVLHVALRAPKDTVSFVDGRLSFVFCTGLGM